MPLKKVEKTAATSAASDAPGGGYLDDLMQFIKKGTVIPIISNSIRIEQIFSDEETLTKQFTEIVEFDENNVTTNEELTGQWAQQINYPMADVFNLARVAQFYQVEEKDPELAKAKYLKFLTDYLLDIAGQEEDYQDVVSQLRNKEARFSDIVQELDYPRFPSGVEDPLRILAKLPLKIYVTTSYYNFIERALEAENKKPRTQVCFWSSDGKPSAKPEPSAELLREPSDTEPIVYHLFGLEDNPKYMVLSEDDYLSFLSSVVEDINNLNPVIPLKLQQGLTESRLILLGYRVADWDFRILFRLINKYRSTESAPRGMLIQLKPGTKESGNKEKSVEYLGHYFDKKQFDLDWTNSEKFIQKLGVEWDKYRMGSK